jgi:hypothetical protein
MDQSGIRIAVGKAGDVLTLVGKKSGTGLAMEPIEQMMDIPGGLRIPLVDITTSISTVGVGVLQSAMQYTHTPMT